MKGLDFPCLTRFTHANLRRAASLSLGGFAMIVMFALAAQQAYAHSLSITASASCSGNQAIISYAVTSWDTTGNGEGLNPDVRVFFNGVQVDKESFNLTQTPPGYFTGMAPVPMGAGSVTVTAQVFADWEDVPPATPFPASQTPVATAPPFNIPNSCSNGTGRFTGGGKVVVSNAIVPASGDVTLTKGFQVECDLDPTHETLELNWGPATHFHMDTITSAACSLTGNPLPPFANVNRIDATGTGKYNGAPGYTVVFTLIDNGEPGTMDQAGFVVCPTDPASPKTCSNPATQVLNVPLQLVSTGNIQAHLDQGH